MEDAVPWQGRRHSQNPVSWLLQPLQHHPASCTTGQAGQDASGPSPGDLDHRLPHRQTTVCQVEGHLTLWSATRELHRGLYWPPFSSPSTRRTSTTSLSRVTFRSSSTTRPLWDVLRVIRRRSTGAWWGTSWPGVTFNRPSELQHLKNSKRWSPKLQVCLWPPPRPVQISRETKLEVCGYLSTLFETSKCWAGFRLNCTMYFLWSDHLQEGTKAD